MAYVNKSDIYKLFDESNGVIKLHIADVDMLPAADVEEVKHGEWLWNKGRGWGEAFYFCSLCAGDSDSGEDNYCPNCGAIMDGGKAE